MSTVARTRHSSRNAAALVSGVLFSAGLCLSGMTHPAKILAFLDVFGAWDPSLALVMVGAIGVAAIAFRVAARRAKPLLDTTFDVGPPGKVDPRLVLGAAIFGAGWGLSGFCPGPAVTSLAGGQVGPLVFVVAMVAGMLVLGLLRRGSASPESPPEPAA